MKLIEEDGKLYLTDIDPKEKFTFVKMPDFEELKIKNVASIQITTDRIENYDEKLVDKYSATSKIKEFDEMVKKVKNDMKESHYKTSNELDDLLKKLLDKNEKFINVLNNKTDKINNENHDSFLSYKRYIDFNKSVLASEQQGADINTINKYDSLYQFLLYSALFDPELMFINIVDYRSLLSSIYANTAIFNKFNKDNDIGSPLGLSTIINDVNVTQKTLLNKIEEMKNYFIAQSDDSFKIKADKALETKTMIIFDKPNVSKEEMKFIEKLSICIKTFLALHYIKTTARVENGYEYANSIISNYLNYLITFVIDNKLEISNIKFDNNEFSNSTSAIKHYDIMKDINNFIGGIVECIQNNLVSGVLRQDNIENYIDDTDKQLEYIRLKFINELKEKQGLQFNNEEDELVLLYLYDAMTLVQMVV